MRRNLADVPEAKVSMLRDGNLGLIKIAGVGTFQGAVTFKAGYMHLIEEGATEFVIDLSECEHLDSTYLGIILGLALKLREIHAGTVHVVHASDMIRSLFRGTGLDQIFDMSRPDTELSGDSDD